MSHHRVRCRIEDLESCVYAVQAHAQAMKVSPKDAERVLYRAITTYRKENPRPDLDAPYYHRSRWTVERNLYAVKRAVEYIKEVRK